MNEDTQEVKEETPKLFNYNKDKKGWVIFNNKAPKIKLRQHIDNLAGGLAQTNDHSKLQNRITLIGVYEATGLKGLATFYINLVRLHNSRELEEIKKELQILKNETDEIKS